MNLEITGRKIEITPAIRKFVEEQVEKTSKFLSKISEVNLTLTVQKHRNIAELIIHAEHGKYTGVEETNDMYHAINLAFDKIIKQARRRHKKMIGRHRKEKNRFFGMFGGSADIELPENPEIIPYKKFSLKPMDIDEASMQLGLSDNVFLVFRNASTEKLCVIYKRKDGHHGLIEPEK